MTNFINCTPHTVVLNSGVSYPASGILPRVANSFTEFDSDGVCRVTYGDPVGLPEPKAGTLYIVSAMILAACPDRKDLVAPATGHPDCVRDNGRIVSVPGFVRN